MPRERVGAFSESGDEVSHHVFDTTWVFVAENVAEVQITGLFAG